MIVMNISLRNMESLLAVLKMPWDAEDVPDHSTIVDTIGEDWLQSILVRTARMYMETAGWTSGSTASDNSGVEMGRYEAVEKNGLKKRRKKYAKYHVASILDLQLVPDSRITSTGHEGTWPDDRDDKRAGAGYGSYSCDTAYDAEENFKLLFEHELDPNIRQRPPGKNPERKDMPNRAKGAEMFDQST